MSGIQPFSAKLLILALAMPGAAQAQSIEFVSDPWEVKLKGRGSTPHRAAQRAFREGGAWQSSMPNLSGWQVIAQEETMLPSRMWGAGIEFDGDGEDKAMAAWAWALDAFHWSQDVVDGVTWVEGPKHDRAFARQMLDGRCSAPCSKRSSTAIAWSSCRAIGGHRCCPWKPTTAQTK